MRRGVRAFLIALAVMVIPACGAGGDGGSSDAGAPPASSDSGGNAPPETPPQGPPPQPGPQPPPPPGDPAFTLQQQQASNAVRTCAPALDGSGDIYIGGPFFAYNNVAAGGVLRLNPNGTVDTAFSAGQGFFATPTDAGVLTVCPMADGDVYVGGTFTQLNGAPAGRIARLNADGTVDTAFAVGAGFTGTTIAAVQEIIPAIDNSGDIYVRVNAVQQYQGAAVNGVVRLNANGTLDAGFVTGTGFNGPVGAIMTVPGNTGDVLAAGPISTYNDAPVNCLVRLNPDGSIDASLVAPNVLNPASMVTGWALAATADATGRFYLAHPSPTGWTLRRLNADGSLDPSFVPNSTQQEILTLLVDPATQDLWLGGEFVSYAGVPNRNRILRLNSDGSFDAGFDAGLGFSLFVYDLAPGPNDSVYAAGSFGTYNWTTGTNGICRVAGNGSLDPLFQCGNGFDWWTYATPGVYVIAPVNDGSGDVYVGGSFASYAGTPTAGLVRLNTDGTRDGSFSVGSGITGNGFARVTSLAPMADGTMYVGGVFGGYNGTLTPGISLVRVGANGALVPGFAFNPDAGSVVFALAPMGEGTGDVYVANGNALLRRTAAGTISPVFQTVLYNPAPGTGLLGGNEPVQVITPALDGTGDVYVGGGFGSPGPSGRISRLNANGTTDNGFVCTLANAGSMCVVRAIVRADDGSGDLFVGGTFRTCNGTAVNEVVRLNADGSIDAAFNTGAPGTGASTGFVNAIRLAGDGSGDVYIGGSFTQFAGAPANRLLRLNANGSLDAGFTSSISGAGNVYALHWQDGDLYVGGSFRVYGTTTVRGLVALNADGSID